MPKKGKGCTSHPKGENDWQDDQYTRHENITSKIQNEKATLDALDKSRGEHQKSTPPSTAPIPEKPTTAYEQRKISKQKEDPIYSLGDY
jgi:hypothetical protein